MKRIKNVNVFIDSNCIQCNSFAKFIKKNVSKSCNILIFSLYDDEIKLISKEKNFEGTENTMYLQHNGKLYKKSTAIFKTVSLLRFPYSLLGAGIIIPLFLRDYLYSYFAKKRKKDYCTI